MTIAATKPDFAKIAILQRTLESRLPPVDDRLRDVERGVDGFRARYRHLRVICSEVKELDGRWWRHASVSRRDRQTPTYDDLKTLKSICIGEMLTAYQVFVPTDRHVNLSEVLHLWACVDGPVTPDFTHGTGSI